MQFVLLHFHNCQIKSNIHSNIVFWMKEILAEAPLYKSGLLLFSLILNWAMSISGLKCDIQNAELSLGDNLTVLNIVWHEASGAK